MMCFHQTPVNCEEYRDANQYYHFHIEFYTPLREANKMKFYASSEMGAWAACNPMAIEETAELLRQAYTRFVGSQEGK
jgi:UDPglucose--hexose-1-phosphate uridylyltransferase